MSFISRGFTWAQKRCQIFVDVFKFLMKIKLDVNVKKIPECQQKNFHNNFQVCVRQIVCHFWSLRQFLDFLVFVLCYNSKFMFDNFCLNFPSDVYFLENSRQNFEQITCSVNIYKKCPREKVFISHFNFHFSLRRPFPFTNSDFRNPRAPNFQSIPETITRLSFWMAIDVLNKSHVSDRR